MKNKKADTWITKEAVILVFAGVLILYTFGFFNKLEAATLNSKNSDSLANFEKRIYNDITVMMSNNLISDYRTENYYLASGNFLVGFDTDWDDTRVVYGKSTISKPYKCGNSACMCLYSNYPNPAPGKNDENVVSCQSGAFSGKDVAFLGESNANPKSIGLARADGKGNYLILQGKGWGVQYTYIEKQYNKDQNKYYIYVSSIQSTNSNDPASIRKKTIDDSKTRQ